MQRRPLLAIRRFDGDLLLEIDGISTNSFEFYQPNHNIDTVVSFRNLLEGMEVRHVHMHALTFGML